MIINVQSGRTERYKTSRGAGARRGGAVWPDPAGWPDRQPPQPLAGAGTQSHTNRLCIFFLGFFKLLSSRTL